MFVLLYLTFVMHMKSDIVLKLIVTLKIEVRQMVNVTNLTYPNLT